MSDEQLKQKMRQLFANVFDFAGWPLMADAVAVGEPVVKKERLPLQISQREVVEMVNHAIDRIVALPPEPPPKGREERVAEVEAIIERHVVRSVSHIIAERIVATEPKVMSREEMLAVVMDNYVERERPIGLIVPGIHIAIDALVGKIPASDKRPEDGDCQQPTASCLQPAASERPDRLSKVIAAVNKWLDTME